MLLRFLNKWECVPLENIITDTVTFALQQKRIYPSHVMYIASLVDSPTLRRLAFLQPPAPRAPNHGFSSANLDPSKWDVGMWIKFNCNYVFALTTTAGVGNESSRAELFERALKTAKAGVKAGPT
jgi:hypothetical protein